jgi:hypothetical protein
LPVAAVPVGLAVGLAVGAGVLVVGAGVLGVGADVLGVGAAGLVVLGAVVDTRGVDVVVVGRGAAVVLRVDVVEVGAVRAAAVVLETWCAAGWTGVAEVTLGHGVTSEAPMTALARPEVHSHRRRRGGRCRPGAARCPVGPSELGAVPGR